MTRKSLGVMATAGLLTVAVAAPTAGQGRVVEIPAGEPITVATLGVISGANASLGQDWLSAVEIAVQDLPEGQLLGHDVQLEVQDGLCTVEGGAQAAQAIASDPTVVGVIGTACSDETVGGVQAITDAGLTMISPSATRPALTAEDRPSEYAAFMRTAHSDAVQGVAVADFVYNTLGLTSAATIHDGSAYAEALVGVFQDAFTELGGTITAREAVSVGQTDMNPVLTSIAATDPDAVYYPIFVAEGGLITDQIGDVAGLEDVVKIGSDGIFTPDFIAAAGPDVQGMYLSSPNFSAFQDEYADLLTKYEEHVGTGPISAFHAHGYDAANMLFDAIEDVAVQNDDGSLSIDLQALRDRLFATQDFQGVTGTLSCTPTGDCGAPLIAVYLLDEAVASGEWPPTQVVWPPADGEMADGEMAEESPAAEG